MEWRIAFLTSSLRPSSVITRSMRAGGDGEEDLEDDEEKLEQEEDLDEEEGLEE